MSSDRPPSGGPLDDSTWPVPPTATPATQPEPTLVIPQAEPTQVVPVGPSHFAGGAWSSVPGPWPPPDPAHGPPAPQPFPPGQPAAYPGPQGFPGQPGAFGPATYGSMPPPGPPTHWTTAPPQPLAGDPWNRQPQRRGHGWLVALITVSVVVVVSLIAAFVVPVLTHLTGRTGGPTPAPTRTAGSRPSATTSPKPTPSSTTSPGKKPTPTMPTAPLDVLRKNPIYALKVPAKCAYQATPASQAAFRKQVRKLVGCENVAWQKALAGTAVTFAKPAVKFYSKSTVSPCGKLGTNFPASYCTGDSTLYFSAASYLQGRYFRLSVAGFVMHEYAHHVQKLAGIFGATSAMKESASAISRRIELQAHCMAHYQLTVSGVGYNSLDSRQIEYQWDFTNDPKGHGSTAAERYWGQRGLDGKSIGACNTWSAKAGRVK